MRWLLFLFLSSCLLVQAGCGNSSGPQAPSISGDQEAGELPSEPAKAEGEPTSAPGIGPQ